MVPKPPVQAEKVSLFRRGVFGAGIFAKLHRHARQLCPRKFQIHDDSYPAGVGHDFLPGLFYRLCQPIPKLCHNLRKLCELLQPISDELDISRNFAEPAPTTRRSGAEFLELLRLTESADVYFFVYIMFNQVQMTFLLFHDFKHSSRHHHLF